MSILSPPPHSHSRDRAAGGWWWPSTPEVVSQRLCWTWSGTRLGLERLGPRRRCPSGQSIRHSPLASLLIIQGISGILDLDHLIVLFWNWCISCSLAGRHVKWFCLALSSELSFLWLLPEPRRLVNKLIHPPLSFLRGWGPTSCREDAARCPSPSGCQSSTSLSSLRLVTHAFRPLHPPLSGAPKGPQVRALRC